ncbi:MAG: lipocalin-like domain-containing protein [Chitinophagaceae bacterium]|nr:lipocalin-like domain-containing protein [Chitinophagaceae bacterium]
MQEINPFFFICIAVICLFICNCNTVTIKQEAADKPALPLSGTWKLLKGIIIDKGDTTVTDYTVNKSFIKIINDNHFAFLLHDLNKGKDSLAAFSAGGGNYSLKDSLYTEHLDYCNDRQWEGNNFSFTITIRNDTLTQTGTEKIEGTDINRLNTEIYVRIK